MDVWSIISSFLTNPIIYVWNFWTTHIGLLPFTTFCILFIGYVIQTATRDIYKTGSILFTFISIVSYVIKMDLVISIASLLIALAILWYGFRIKDTY